MFRKDIEPHCAYCVRGKKISEDKVVCHKHGVVSAQDSCRSFRYDPLKRVPPRPAVLPTNKLRPEDFEV